MLGRFGAFVLAVAGFGVLGIPAAAAGAPVPAFSAAAGYETDWYPQAVISADVNADGFPDLVTANAGYGTVSVLLGRGDGTFSAAPDATAGAGASALAAGDLNGDGHADLVVADAYLASVSVLLGNGDGTFGAPANIQLFGLQQGSSGLNGVSIADLNGDGNADVVVSDSDGSVSVLLGQGDGTFRPAAVYPTGGFLTDSVAVSDVNADGVPDLVTASAVANTVSVLLGNGDGTFGTAMSYPAGTSPEAVVVSDLDADGRPDLAVVNSGHGVSVLLGHGDGTFGPAVAYALPSGASPTDIAAADLNHDGTPDLAISMFDTTTVAVLPGNGDGTFGSGFVFDVGSKHAASVAAADLNGDGQPDLAVSISGSNGHSVSVLLNAADRTPPTLDVTATAGGQPYTAGTWTNADVTVSYSCTDAGSGVDALTPSGPTVVTTEGVTVVDGRCTDRAGNFSTGSFAVWIDKQPPAITWSDHPATYALTDTVSISCSASDASSGVVSSTCHDLSAPAWTLPGESTLTATATDAAGNVGEGSTTFEVGVTYDGLCALTRAFVDRAAAATPFCAHLKNAQRAAYRGRTNEARAQMDVYTAAVERAARQQVLTVAQATTLSQLGRLL